MRIPFLSLALFVWFFAATPSGWGADPGVGEWTTLGNGPSHSGYYPKTIGNGTFALAWTKDFATQVNQPAISGERLYLTTSNMRAPGTRAFALSTTDGAEQWSYPLADAASINPPTFWNGRLYFQRNNSSGDAHLWCLNAGNGGLLWATPFDSQWGSFLAPAVVDGGAFFNGGTYGGLYGVNATTGAQRFFVNRPQQSGWTPSYAAGVLYSCVEGSFLATSASTGSQLWVVDLKATTTGTALYWLEGNVPAVSGGRAAVVGGGRLVMMDLATRSLAWFKAGDFSGVPAMANGVVYAISSNGVQAFRASDGTALGVYGTGRFSGQPIVTQDRLIVASPTSTVIFDLETFEAKQTIETGGRVNYAAGSLYLVRENTSGTSSLLAYRVTPAEADPATTTVPSPPASLPAPHPNPSRSLGASAVTWLDGQRFGDIAYFLFQSPAKLERYDLAASSWLPPISLPAGPQAFAVGQGGIFVSFGKSLSRFTLDGATETPLGNTAEEVKLVLEISGKLYLGNANGTKLIVLDAATGATLQSTAVNYAGTGFSVAAAKMKIFSRITESSQAGIAQLSLRGDGAIAGQTTSSSNSYTYPAVRRTYLFPGEGRVMETGGSIYSTNDLSYLGSLGNAFDDLAFAGDSPVVLRGSQLVAYSNGFLETGRVSLSGTPTRIWTTGTEVVSFAFSAGRGVVETKTPLAGLVPPTTNAGVDPNNLVFIPDAVELGNGEVIYLLSKRSQSIFRWSISQHKYLSTIALADVPQSMAYASANNRLYLSYSDGRMTRIALDDSFEETGFANAPLYPGSLTVAGEYVFAETGNANGASHLIYSADGTLLTSREGSVFSTQFVWNSTNRKMYYFRNAGSPYNLLWTDIDLDGKFGDQFESPPQGSNYYFPLPFRVSPDGTQAIFGNGDLYSGVTLTRLGALTIKLVDAAWAGTTTFTLGGAGTPAYSLDGPSLPVYSAGQVSAWDAAQQQLGTVPTTGRPLRIYPLADGVLTVSVAFGKPRFAKFGFDLAPISVDPPPEVPIATTRDATQVSMVGAQLNGVFSAQEFSDAHFEYGETTEFGSRADATITVVENKWVARATIAGLTANRPYYFRLVATGPDGPIYGSELSFNTFPNTNVKTSPASEITPSEARLNGQVTTGSGYSAVYFEWGPTTAYGQTVPASFDSAANALDACTAVVGELEEATTYHYRMVATYAAGDFPGPDQIFTTRRIANRDFTLFMNSPAGFGLRFDLLGMLGAPNGRIVNLSHPSLGDLYFDYLYSLGDLVYAPRVVYRNFSGSDSFLYVVDDLAGNIVSGRVTLINPYFRARGTFSSVFPEGRLTATLSSAGALSGRVVINGVTVSFSGFFRGEGTFETTVKNAKLGNIPIQLELVFIDGKYRVVGTINGIDVTAPQTLAPAAVSPHAGTYTLMVPPDPEQEINTLPQGVGYAQMTVSAAGMAKLVGQLADGKAFSGSGRIVAGETGDTVQVTAKVPYPKVGSLSGTLAFADLPDSDCEGNFLWQKPGQTTGIYPAGFSTTSAVTGCRYAPPLAGFAAVRFGYVADGPNAHFEAGSGNLSEDLDEDLEISSRTVVTSITPNTQKLKLTLNARTGLLTGSFTHPATNKATNFRGVALSKLNFAAGYFLGPTESGWVSLWALGSEVP